MDEPGGKKTLTRLASIVSDYSRYTRGGFTAHSDWLLIDYEERVRRVNVVYLTAHRNEYLKRQSR